MSDQANPLAGVSTEDLLAYKAGDLSKVSTTGLLAIKAARSGAPAPPARFAAQREPIVAPPGATAGPAFAPESAVRPFIEPPNARMDESMARKASGYQWEATPQGQAESRIAAERDAERASRREASPPGFFERTAEGFAGGLMAAPMAAEELVRRRSPGGDLFEVNRPDPAGPRLDKPAWQAVAAGALRGGTGSSFSLLMPGLTTAFSGAQATPIGEKAFGYLHKPGEMVKEAGGGELAVELTDQAVNLAAMMGAHKAVNAGAARAGKAWRQAVGGGKIAPERGVNPETPGATVKVDTGAGLARGSSIPAATPEAPPVVAPIPPRPQDAEKPVPATAPEARPTAPKSGMVVAARDASGNVIYGNPGDIHINLAKQVPPGALGKMEQGFAGPDGKFLTRQEALDAVDLPVPKRDFGLDAKDYQEAQVRAARAARAKPTPAPPPAPETPPAPTEIASVEGTAGNAAGAKGDVTLGSNRLLTPEMAKQAEGWIETAERPINAVTRTIRGKIAQIPGVRPVAESIANLAKSPEARVSKGFEETILKGRGRERGTRYDIAKAVKELEAAKLDEAQMEEAGKSLSSEPADLSKFMPEQRAVVESVRGKLQGLRSREVEAQTMSHEVFAEYPQGHLTRFLKPGTLPERILGQRGGVKVKAYTAAQDMPSLKVKLPASEVRSHLGQEQPRLLKQDGKTTLVKFNDTPEGRAARDGLAWSIEQSYKTERSQLGAEATREIKSSDPRAVRQLQAEAETIPTRGDALELGADDAHAKALEAQRGKLMGKSRAAMNTADVREAKALVRAEADVPRAADLGIELGEPVPPDVAARIFEPSTPRRLLGTMAESGSRLAKAETLKDLSKLVDEKGPIAIEAVKGEPPPDGFEMLASAKGRDYGALDGKWVRADAAKYVRGAFESTPEAPSGVENMKGVQRAIMERFKVSRLLYNPRQWFRQIPSNIEFENLMGFSNWNPRYIQHKIRGLQAMREGSPYYRIGLEAGFFDPAMVSKAELGLMEEAMGSKGNPGYRVTKAILTGGVSELAPGKLRSVESFLGRAYSKADSWTKMSGLRFAVEELGMTPDQAVAYVRKWTPSPESVSNAVKAWSGSIIGDPWFRYRAEQARINAQALAEKPIRLAMNRAQGSLIRGAAVLGGASLLSDDEKKALENEQGSGAIALGRDEQNRPLGLDYKFLSTIGDLAYADPATIGKEGDDEFDRAMEISGAGNNPFLSILAEQKTGRDRYGRPINPEGTRAGRVSSFLSQLQKTFVPDIAGRHVEKLKAAIEGKPYSPYQPAQTVPQAILDVGFGFKLTPLDADYALQKIARQGATAVEDITAKFRRDAINGQPIDMERLKELAESLKADMANRTKPLQAIQPTQGR